MKKFLRSFTYAFKGIGTAFKSEFNLRFHCIATLIVIFAAILFQINRMQFCVLMLCCGFVITAEVFNTAIETLTNLVSPAQSEIARKTKDIAAAAVLIAVITSVIVGVIIFLPNTVAITNERITASNTLNVIN